MPAIFTSFPSYVVFDRTYGAIITSNYAAGASPPYTESGTKQNIIDRDLTTAYSVSRLSNDVWLKIDYNQIIWNATFFIKYHLLGGWDETGGVKEKVYLQISTDDSTWTTLDENISVTGVTRAELNKTTGYSVPCLRYLRAYAEGSSAGKTNLAEISECHLMGSV